MKALTRRSEKSLTTKRFGLPLGFFFEVHLSGGRQKRAFDVENISPAVLM
jgi:hypothetical protein